MVGGISHCLVAFCPFCWLCGWESRSAPGGNRCCIRLEPTYIVYTLQTGGQIAFIDGMGSLRERGVYDTYWWLVMRTSEYVLAHART